MTSRTTVRSGRSRPARARARRRILASAIATAVLSSTAACTQNEGAAGDDAPEVTEGASSLEPAVTVASGPAPTVELLEAGEDEQRVLAYAASRGPAVVDVTRSASATTTLPGREPQTDTTPEQTLTLEGLSEPDVDGAQRATVTVQEFTSVDELRSAQFATAPGFVVTWTRSAEGVVRQISLEAPSGATDAARAAVEITANAISEATVAWPTEEIGVGARWRVTRRVDDAVAPERATTYELTELDGDVATVRTSTTAPDPSDTLTAPSPDGGPDATLGVDSYEVTGSGELTVDLRAALPLDGSTESSTRAVYVDPETGSRTTHDEESALEFSPAG